MAATDRSARARAHRRASRAAAHAREARATGAAAPARRDDRRRARARARRSRRSELEGARRAERAGLPIRDHAVLPLARRSARPGCPIRRSACRDAREAHEVAGRSRRPARRGGARGRAASRAALPRSRAPPRDRSLRRLLPLLHALAHGRRRRRRGLARATRAGVRVARAHPEVRDVIVSGGDPLAMATDRLVALVARAPRDPERRDHPPRDARPRHAADRASRASSCARSGRYHPLWVMTHFNHPKELTPESRARVRALADAGFPVMNQTVLLRGVNDDARDARGALSRARARARAARTTCCRSIRCAAPGTSARRSRAGVAHHGAPPGAALRHRAAEAHLRHARRQGQGPARARLRRRSRRRPNRRSAPIAASKSTTSIRFP